MAKQKEQAELDRSLDREERKRGVERKGKLTSLKWCGEGAVLYPRTKNSPVLPSCSIVTIIV